ncbi:MAG: hypothetical protein HEQ35_22530 [Gloeotrichia echinulata IR180]|nr:hypothetical protein [Gloeotrichia echinulata DEX184]
MNKISALSFWYTPKDKQGSHNAFTSPNKPPEVNILGSTLPDNSYSLPG